MDRGDRIRAYFTSCNVGDAAEIAAHFTDGATIYDTNHAPVVGAEAIGAFWDRIRAQWSGAIWGVDTVVAEADTAAIEWHMAGTGTSGPFVFRGSEHYAFDGDLIAEIRQYWTFDPAGTSSGLHGFPYDQHDTTSPR